jgi:hypothetical protein
VFNKRKTEEREKTVPMDEPVSEQPNSDSEITDTELPMVEQEDTYPSSNGGNGGAKPANGNLKPSIISEGFEFIGEIRSNGYLTIDGTVRGTLSLHSIQIGNLKSLRVEVDSQRPIDRRAIVVQLDARAYRIRSYWRLNCRAP